MTMTVEINARNMELKDQIKDYITKKASKLDRYLNELEHVKVDLAYVKTARDATDRNVAQITAKGRKALLRTEERGFLPPKTIWPRRSRNSRVEVPLDASH